MGAVVGAVVGALVGRVVGALVGRVVGALVGAVVGALVGAGVGDVVGATVGAVVGAVVGVGVGVEDAGLSTKTAGLAGLVNVRLAPPLVVPLAVIVPVWSLVSSQWAFMVTLDPLRSTVSDPPDWAYTR